MTYEAYEQLIKDTIKKKGIPNVEILRSTIAQMGDIKNPSKEDRLGIIDDVLRAHFTKLIKSQIREALLSDKTKDQEIKAIQSTIDKYYFNDHTKMLVISVLDEMSDPEYIIKPKNVRSKESLGKSGFKRRISKMMDDRGISYVKEMKKIVSGGGGGYQRYDISKETAIAIFAEIIGIH